MLAALVAWWLLVAGGQAQGGQETIVLPQPLPPQVERIELVWSNGSEPTVTVNPVEPVAIRGARLTGTEVRLTAGDNRLRPFGSCLVHWQQQGEAVVVRFTGRSKGPCGLVWFFGGPAQAVDALSFQSLHVRGTASNQIELGVADQYWWDQDDHVPFSTTGGTFDVATPLAQLAGRVHVGALVALIMTTRKLPTELRIDRAWFEAHPAPPAVTMERGLWVWDLRKASEQANRVAETCRSIGCRRLALQMPALADPDSAWIAFRSLIRRWQDEGFDVYALDGDPNTIKQPGPLLSTIERLMAELGESMPIGLQLDIEPYLLGEVRTDLSWYRAYLTLLQQVRRSLPAGVPLSVVVPFWFTSVMVDGLPLAQRIFEAADEVVVMNYRSDVQEARALIEDWGRYGLVFGKPVWGAIETRPLPDERHLILQRVDRWEEATAFCDPAAGQLILAKPSRPREGLFYLREAAQFVVRGEWLSYAGHSKETVAQVMEQWAREAGSVGIAGLMVHDWEGYEQLPGASPLSSTSLNGGDERDPRE